LFAIWKSKDYRLRAFGALLLVFTALLPWLSFDEVLINPPYRARYLLAVVFYPMMAWVVWNYWIPNVRKWLAPKDGLVGGMNPTKPSFSAGAGRVRETLPIIIATVIAFVYVSSVFVYVVRLQAEFSSMVTPATARALEVIRNAPEKQAKDSKTTATNAFTLSLWVAGINKTRNPFLTTAPPPPAYIDSDILLRCSFGWIDDCDGRVASESLGIRYILVEERFPYYNDRVPGNYLAPDNQWEVTANTEWLNLIYSEGTTRLYEVQ